MNRRPILFCPFCGVRVVPVAIDGAIHPQCPQCSWIHFQDPKVAVAALIECDDRVLLAQRVNDPYRECWTLPGGFVNAYEELESALSREIKEETGLVMRSYDLLTVFSGREHPRGADILLVYQVEVEEGEMKAGDDASKVAFFSRKELPPLAFRATKAILEG